MVGYTDQSLANEEDDGISATDAIEQRQIHEQLQNGNYRNALLRRASVNGFGTCAFTYLQHSAVSIVKLFTPGLDSSLILKGAFCPLSQSHT